MANAPHAMLPVVDLPIHLRATGAQGSGGLVYPGLIGRAARGNRGAILRTYQNCAAVLQRELAIEPGLTTRKTYERLMRAEV